MQREPAINKNIHIGDTVEIRSAWFKSPADSWHLLMSSGPVIDLEMIDTEIYVKVDWGQDGYPPDMERLPEWIDVHYVDLMRSASNGQ